MQKLEASNSRGPILEDLFGKCLMPYPDPLPPLEFEILPSRTTSATLLFRREVKDSRVQQAVDFLRRGRPISSRTVASLVNLSPSRFRHLFRDEVGVSPT